jgi:hypothetical protein
MGKYYFSEPVKGEVYKYEAVESGSTTQVQDRYGNAYSVSSVRLSNGALASPDIPPGYVWEETDEWLIKYQDSLSMRVSQIPMEVYFCEYIKRGKRNSRVLVVNRDGALFHCMVPTLPVKKMGDSVFMLQMDLTLVSLTPVEGLLDKVLKAKELL